MTRPRLCPVTLRWLADEYTRKSTMYRGHVYRGHDGFYLSWAMASKDEASKAKRLRNLATREEKRK